MFLFRTTTKAATTTTTTLEDTKRAGGRSWIFLWFFFSTKREREPGGGGGAISFLFFWGGGFKWRKKNGQKTLVINLHSVDNERAPGLHHFQVKVEFLRESLPPQKKWFTFFISFFHFFFAAREKGRFRQCFPKTTARWRSSRVDFFCYKNYR